MRLPLIPPHLAYASREDIKRDFLTAWAMTDTLFDSLRSEEAFLRPPYHGLRHPLIFYFGHSAVFYMNKLRLAGLMQDYVDPYIENHFAIGVDEHSWDDMSKNEKAWPPLEQVRAYRKLAFKAVIKLIESHPELTGGHATYDDEHPLWALLMSIEHERIHIETTSVLIRELPLECVQRPKGFPALHPSALKPSSTVPEPRRDFPENEWIKIASGNVRIGKPKTWPIYGWDNEYGAREENVDSFDVARFLVSNGEYFDFVRDGGYSDPRYWTKEGWAWRSFRDTQHPAFWRGTPQGGFKLRTCFEEIEMPWSWPVIANFHEAKAYANWRTRKDGRAYRLLSEGEHHRLRHHIDPSWDDGETPISYERWFGTDGRQASPLYRSANFNLRFGSESPVDRDARERNASVCDVFGNVWQWCEDEFRPLDGFRTHPLYEDYSTPSFDGKHRLILGGSFISTGEQASPWVRSNFREHFFQHAGIRLVR